MSRKIREIREYGRRKEVKRFNYKGLLSDPCTF